VENGILGVII